DAALYIDSGYGLYIAGNESNVTRAIQNLSDGLERAEGLAVNRNSREPSELERALAQARELRQQMQDMQNQQGQPGQQQGQGQQQDQQNQQQAQNGQPQEGQGQQQGSQQGG